MSTLYRGRRGRKISGRRRDIFEEDRICRMWQKPKDMKWEAKNHNDRTGVQETRKTKVDDVIDVRKKKEK